jgi:hypothetical protein
VSQQIRYRRRPCWLSASGRQDSDVQSYQHNPLDRLYKKYKRPISLKHIVGNGPSLGLCRTIGKRILARHVPRNCLGLASTLFDNPLIALFS